MADTDSKRQRFHQLPDVIDEIRNNLDDKRIVLSVQNPSDLTLEVRICFVFVCVIVSCKFLFYLSHRFIAVPMVIHA